ncbi:glycosyltransferase family 4 protein [Metabacillus litoralis]|uniref:glycosyltransferase family 4 protein n=1 Tax=Metabacillus litoralis TaxID=152268 RepID=UPI001CFDDE38|nr:glycosyltransferase family 4 protein [Metabacillus litoralis]
MNKKQKDASTTTVLILSTEYKENLIGGLGRHVTDLVETGKNHNISFIVITLSPTVHESYSCENGIHIFRLLPWKKHSSNFLDYIMNVNFRFSQFVFQELKLSFDLIHAHDWLTGIAACSLKKQLHKPLISTIHSTEEERKFVTQNKTIQEITIYESELIHTSDRVIVCSKYMYRLVVDKFNVAQEKINMIPNGIISNNYELEGNHPSPYLKSIISTPYVLALGRLVTEKGFHLLLDAFSKIEKDFPTLNLIIAGEGPAGMKLKQQVDILGMEKRVHFPGYVNEAERNMLLSSCSILVIPSLYEPFGIIALEGMIYTKPIVSFNIGGLADVLADNRGILITKTNSKELAKHLRYCFIHSKETQDMAKKGFQTVNLSYQWKNLIYDIINVYKEARNS